jgi:hypothetical protein
VIGSTLIATVPLRRLLSARGYRLGDKGYVAGAAFWGMVMGGTTGAGIILLSLLMAAGLEGAAVIATDAMVSVVVGAMKLAVFGFAGVVGHTVLAVGILIGAIGFSCTFLAKLIVERLPVHMHTAILDVVVLVGGGTMIFAALRP